jgi:ABC-type polysaccharide/polyol phosphate transport system ATPase subunit
MPGLDPEDTGHENTLTAGLLLGMTRHEIEAKVPEIEEISELGEYPALPMRTYSSGMVTRLRFALAIAVEPGILLMDEGIATGDARFAERAALRLKEFIGRSRIVVLASHSVEIIRSTCNKAALMLAGTNHRLIRTVKAEAGRRSKILAGELRRMGTRLRPLPGLGQAGAARPNRGCLGRLGSLDPASRPL